MGKNNKGFEKTPIPAYLTSFADMMTILLTFFILLYSYSEQRHTGVVKVRAKAFDVSIRNLGLPGLMSSSNNSINFGRRKPQYPTFPGFSKHKDPTDEKKFSKHLPYVQNIGVTEFTREHDAVIVLPIAFETKKTNLTLQQKKYLLPLLSAISQHKTKVFNIEVVVNNEFDSTKKNLQLAFQRAKNAAIFINETAKIPFSKMRPIARAIPESKQSSYLTISFEPF